ncbi:MAG: hypothetical protein ACR2N3_12620 [Pyrinomonadaceae bacterium]
MPRSLCASLPEKVSAWDAIAWTLGETNLPEQRDLAGRFDDPPITLYNSPRFHIDIYFWLDGTTSIHQHGFCGAFQVLLGSSLHSSYDFEPQEILNTFTEIGALAETLPRIFAQQEKIGEITNRRAYITDAEQRFFLALLLNVEGRERIFSLVKLRFPDENPLDKILDWVSALSQTKILGSNVPNALGIEGFNDFDLIALEDLLNGLSVEEMQKNLQAETRDEEAVKDLKSRIEKIRQSVILQPLLEN